jgi:hypothetical protein
MPAELEEATRLASWRAENVPAIETTQFERQAHSSEKTAFERKPFEPAAPDNVASSPSDRSAPRAWPPRDRSSILPAPSTPEGSNGAPVVLSSAISAEDDLKPSADVRGVINAIAEQPNPQGADFLLQAEPHSKASSQLFVPALPAPSTQDALFAPAPPAESTLALAGKTGVRTVGAVDLLDEELLIGESEKPGLLSNHFWTIMGILIAAGAVLFGLLRQSRGKKEA